MEKSSGERWHHTIFIVFICILACFYYYHFFIDRVQVRVEIEVSQKSAFKLYWSDDKQQFSEKHSAVKRVYPNQSNYEFSIPGLADYTQIRIDPMRYGGEALLKTITISQKGYEPIEVDLVQLQPLNQLENITISDAGLHFRSTGKDPFFLYSLKFKSIPFRWLNDFLTLVSIALLLIIVVNSWTSLRPDFGYVPILLSMVLILIVVMAAISKRNVHPDEYVHIAATSYYENHWLPPEVDAKEIEDTYSVYGMSRLNNGEVYYLLAGKVAWLSGALGMDNPLSARLFNVMLFLLIVSYTVCSVPARVVAVPFLISPQIWYVFSYCTSDAFALFICFLAGCELVRPASFLNKALLSESILKRIISALLIGLLLGLLFLLKKNYYPFIAIFYFCLLIRIFHAEESMNRMRLIFRIFIFTVLAIGVAGFRMGMDYYVNGMDRQEKLLVMQEKTANKHFKPSTKLEEKHIYLHKKDRGIPLKSLIVKDKWFGKTFKTGFGMYGYFTIIGPETYYEIVKWFALALLAYTLANVLIRGSTTDMMLAALVVMMSIALIGASLHHSWTMDFQAQGRYLFPILSMFGVILGRCRTIFETRLFVLSVSQLYLVGLYSFIFVALMNIPRG